MLDKKVQKMPYFNLSNDMNPNNNKRDMSQLRHAAKTEAATSASAKVVHLRRNLAIRYGRDDVASCVARFRYEHADKLVAHAEDMIEQIRRIDARFKCVLGGSLLSRTSVKGNNDIDLRVLLPKGQDGPTNIAQASRKIATLIPFDRKLENREDIQLAYHHKKTMRVKDIPGEVKIDLNIQPAEGYYGLAAKSARMPQELRDRYTVAKGLARERGKDDDYQAIKDHWKDLIYWLTEQGYFSTAAPRRRSMLKRAQLLFPLFFPPARQTQ